MPAFSMPDASDGSFTACASAFTSVSTTGFGVCAGTYTPIQMFSEASGNPFSTMVGTFGKAATRVGDVVTSAMRSPERMSGASDPNPLVATVTCPPMMAFFTGPVPWNGTWTRSRPYAILNSSMLKNDTVPYPADP